MAHKIVLCGAGFLGRNIAHVICQSTRSLPRAIQVSSRHPDKTHAALLQSIPTSKLLPPVPIDVTKPESLLPAFRDAKVVVSLVGLLMGSPEDFDRIQWRGVENVARAANEVDAKLIHFSAIGADAKSDIPYMRTKGLAEQAVFQICPSATVIRPSLVFGPDDDLFNKFSRLSQFLPFLPVFDGGTSRFQPVFVKDIARAVEVLTRHDGSNKDVYGGKIIDAGGPEVFTFRELMNLVLRYNRRTRPIISLPLKVGMLQGAVMERLPPNLFTITRDQLKQLTMDNVVPKSPIKNHISMRQLFEDGSLGSLTSAHEVLPLYL
ncbi:hypothetical protein APHAL10511_006033 [Amanita phalloides]|nr:hypothetical protein APHAL10511_006033 [Amanita phalloides]